MKAIKRVLAALLVLALALSLSACGGSGVNMPTLTPEETSDSSGGTEIVHRKPDETKYEDTLVGLMSFLEDGRAVVRDTGKSHIEGGAVKIEDENAGFVQTSYKEIGAKNGYRYLFSLNKNTVQVELYEFDPANLDDKAKECVSMVREKGCFKMLDKEVKAELHPSGKYLLVYLDGSVEKNEGNAAQKAWAEELFRGFKAS